MDSAKNKKLYKVTPHKSIYIYIYIYIYVKKEIKSQMCSRIKKSANSKMSKQVGCAKKQYMGLNK